MRELFLIAALGATLWTFQAKGKELIVLSQFEKYDPIFKKYSARYSVPWRWLKAIAMNESSLGTNPRVLAGLVSSDGLSWGLMQVTLTTAKDLYKREVSADELKNNEISVDLAAKYLQRLMRYFPGDAKKIIMSYNQGEGNTMRGKEYALPYWEKFNKHMKIILEKQPGSEIEIGG